MLSLHALAPPKPGLIYQLLGLGFILFLALLQFLPATHFRHPADPFRIWVPFSYSNLSSPLASTQSWSSSDATSGHVSTRGGEDEIVHVVSWMDCLDLRVLAVLANSTLTNTRYPEKISFHFFIPGGLHDKVSYYKLKVLFPHSNLEILGQEIVKDRIMMDYSMGEYPWRSFYEIAPFVIPAVYPTLSKFVYVSPHAIIKGKAEEMVQVNLQKFGIAVGEDCSKRLSSYVNYDVLDAIQRTAAKPWVSSDAYPRDACMPDLSLVLFDSSGLELYLLEAILWWTRVLNKSERDGLHSAVALSIYDRHIKLDKKHRSLIQHYGDSQHIYSESCGGVVRPDLMKLWSQYLPPMSDQILASN